MGRRFGSSPNKSFSSPNRWAEDFQKPLASGRPGLDRRFNQAQGSAGRGVGGNSLGRDLGPSGDEQALSGYLRNQLDPRRIAGGITEQLLNGTGIKKPDGFYDWIPNNPGGGAFISDVNDTVEKRPSDCQRWPDSPFCKLPIGNGPLGVGADLGVTKCEVCVSLRYDIAFNRIPINTFCYRRRDAECYKPPKVPRPDEQDPTTPPSEGGDPISFLLTRRCAIGWYVKAGETFTYSATSTWPGPGRPPEGLAVVNTIINAGTSETWQNGGFSGLLDWYKVLRGEISLRDPAAQSQYGFTATFDVWDIAAPSNRVIYPNGPEWVRLNFAAAGVIQWVYLSFPDAMNEEMYADLQSKTFTQSQNTRRTVTYYPNPNTTVITTSTVGVTVTIKPAIFASVAVLDDYVDAPPPPLPPPPKENEVTCCADTQDKLNYLITKLGLKKLPANVTASMTDDNEATIKIENTMEYLHWFARNVFEHFGEWPIKIQVKTDEEEQSAPMNFPNVAEALAELYGLAFSTSRDSDSGYATGIATLGLLSKLFAMEISSHDLAFATASFLGFRLNGVGRKIELPFNPEADPGTTSQEKLFKATEQWTDGYENEDQTTLYALLERMMLGISVLKENTFTTTTPGKIAERLNELVDLIKGETKTPEDWDNDLKAIQDQINPYFKARGLAEVSIKEIVPPAPAPEGG